MKKENIDLTTGVVWWVMFQFALPIFMGAFFQSLYTMVDAIIVGRFAGKGALASIEAVLAITKLPINFFTGLGVGATIIISQYYGAKKLDKVSTASHNAMLFALVGGLILSFLGVVLAPIATRITKVPADVVVGATNYLRIYLGGMVISMLYNFGAGILRALGNSKTPFYFLIIANIVNVILDLVFIAVLGWGVVGAAMATVMASCLSATLIIVTLFKTNLACKLKMAEIKFYKEHLLEIVKLGLPIGMQSALYPVANTTVQSSINQLGVDSIAAWSISGKLDFLIWNISSSFSFAISTFVAQNIGAKQDKRAMQGVRSGLAMAIGLIAVVSTLLYFYCEPMAKLLLEDSNVIALNKKIIYLFVPFYFLYAVCDGLSGAIKGTGDTFRPMIVYLIGTCIFRIIWIVFVVPLRFDLITVLACYPISWGLTSLIFIVFYFYKFHWRNSALAS